MYIALIFLHLHVSHEIFLLNVLKIFIINALRAKFQT